MSDEFNVVQFFQNDRNEYVRRHVSAEEAVRAAHHYCTSVGAKVGTTRRVIITDGGDNTNFEWRYGEGFVYRGYGLPPSPWSLEDNLQKYGGGL